MNANRGVNTLPFLCLPCHADDEKKRGAVTGWPMELAEAGDIGQMEIAEQGVCPICLGELVEFDDDDPTRSLHRLQVLDHTPEKSHWFHDACLSQYVDQGGTTCPRGLKLSGNTVLE